jgi:arsenate reductase
MSDKITLSASPTATPSRRPACGWTSKESPSTSTISRKPARPRQVQAWLKGVERDVLVNRKGTTWRALPDERKAAITDDAAAVR